ncbi:hypothetical protein BH10ACI4_BH10ACI4_11630 [soil metagenome]
MEAIERQTACQTRLPIIYGSLEGLQASKRVIDPRTLKYDLVSDYSTLSEYSWVVGMDLISGEEVLVPAHIAGYMWFDVPGRQITSLGSSNGLASGNVREEAICQALCELIERDAWTLADLGAHLLPIARRRAVAPRGVYNGPDDTEMFPSLEEMDDHASESFRAVGLQPVLHDITSDIGIPTVIAVVSDESVPSMPMLHAGAGTHPDARVAVKRALTEVAQSRCVDIQSVREDLALADWTRDQSGLQAKRVSHINHECWFLSKSRQQRPLNELPSAISDDVSDDLAYLLGRLVANEITEVIVIDFTPQNEFFSVVRVIVPDLEQASVQRGPVGRRALQFWRSHV